MKNKGFSLVELIVVIAIMAILVGVAVPVYSSYIEKAQISTDKNLVDEIIHSVEIANAADPFTGTAAVILSNDGNATVTGGSEAEKQWLVKVLTDTFGTDYAAELKLKHDGWGNGVAVAQVMLNALRTGDIADAMEGIYGSADNLSFTEEIPALLEEIKNVAVEVAGGEAAADDVVIGIVNGAAAVTSTWSPSAIQDLWQTKISYDGAKYVHTANIPDGTEDFDEKLTIAGLIRAKNTCLALYAKEKGYGEYYSALSAYSPAGSILPLDLTYEVTTTAGKASIAQACGLDLNDSADAATAAALVSLMNEYYSAKDSKGNYIYANDATAYCAMMNIVDTMAEDETLSGNDLDEYFESVSGPAALFQQMVEGTISIESLNSSLSGVTAGNNNITISFVGNGEELMVVVGPSSVLE